MSYFKLEFEEEEEELGFYYLLALYRLFMSLNSHLSCIQEKKGETEFEYRETWNFTTATLFFFTCPEYSSNTRDQHFMSLSDGTKLGNRAAA